MWRLSLRLVFGGGREALTRLVVIAAGVMIGVTLLLFALSGLQVMNGSSKRICWQCTGRIQSTYEDYSDAKNYPILWLRTDDYYRGQSIHRVDMALRGPTDSSIPGIPRLPKDGEYYASPALAHLLQTVPADQLADRFPGKMVGQIGRAGLNAPNTLIAVVGRTPASLDTITGTAAVKSIHNTPDTTSLAPVVLALVGMAVGGLLFAVFTLIATSTRLAAARREEKFATLRLMGATPRQINRFAAVDAAVSAGVGALAGFALFYALRSVLVGALSSDTIAFFPSDLNPGLVGGMIVLLGTPFLAAGAALLSLRRVRISPLGVARRATPKSPTAWRIALLPLGLAVLLAVWWRNRHIANSDVRGEAVPYFMVGFGLVIVGLVIAGPWLTMIVNKLAARSARGASLLLASRHLADNPKAAFRPMSVMIVAVFLCTIIAVATPLFVRGITFQQKSVDNVLETTEYFHPGKLSSASEASRARQLLEAAPGVHVVPLHTLPGQAADRNVVYVLISCQDAARLQAFGHCTSGATALRESAEFQFNDVTSFGQKPLSVSMEAAALQRLPVYNFVVLTDGQPAHIEQLRTVLNQHQDIFSTGITWKERSISQVKLVASIQLLINGGLLIVLFVAGCSLAVAAAGGLVERKRPFGLLRVAGMSLGQLVRVVVYESVAPLLATTLLAVGTALFVIRMLLLSFGDRPVVVPGLSIGYCLLVSGGVALGLVVLLTTLPILAAITRPSHVRFE